MIKIEFWNDPEEPANTGWYINYYDNYKDMHEMSPYDSIGPYDTDTEARRVLHDTGGKDDERKADV